MTTAPRPQPTLERCLKSLAAAGWDHPRLFAEPGVDVPLPFDTLPITRRDVALGAFPNWCLGLAELFMREPRAEAYFMCQDDVILSKSLREYLEARLWPVPRVGIVSVYCPSHYLQDHPAGFHAVDEGWNTWGALAYVFPNPSVRALISDPLFVKHRHHGLAEGKRNIDSIVGRWCRESGLPYYVHAPSLAQHIGDTSTIWSIGCASGRRRASTFVGETTDWLPTASTERLLQQRIGPRLNQADQLSTLHFTSKEAKP